MADPTEQEPAKEAVKEATTDSTGFVAALMKRTGGFVLIAAGLSLVLLVILSALAEFVFSHETQNLDNTLELGVHTWSSPALDVLFNLLTAIGSVGGLLAVSVLAGIVFL